MTKAEAFMFLSGCGFTMALVTAVTAGAVWIVALDAYIAGYCYERARSLGRIERGSQ